MSLTRPHKKQRQKRCQKAKANYKLPISSLLHFHTFIYNCYFFAKKLRFLPTPQIFSCPLYEMMVWLYEVSNHFFPVNSLKIALPIFRSTPALEVGIPVALAILCFVCVIPNARFHEKLRRIRQQFSLNR